jgi:hypothetical protein
MGPAAGANGIRRPEPTHGTSIPRVSYIVALATRNALSRNRWPTGSSPDASETGLKSPANLRVISAASWLVEFT